MRTGRPRSFVILAIALLAEGLGGAGCGGSPARGGVHEGTGDWASPGVAASRPAGEADLGQGIRGRVVKLVGDFMPASTPGRGERRPLAVPVHVFRGKVQPIDRPDPNHPALVRIVRADKDGRFAISLQPGEFTVVAEIAGRLYLNNWTDDGSWTTVTVSPGRWTSFTIEDVTEAEF